MTFHAGRGFPDGLPHQLLHGAGVSELVSVGAAVDAELSVGDGAGVEVPGCGLSVGDGLLLGDGLLVGDGTADGDVAGELAGDGGTVFAVTGIGCTAVGTGIGSVGRAADVGNRVMAGSPGAWLWLADGGADVGSGVGAGAGEAETGMGTPRLTGPTAAPLAVAVGKPTGFVDPAKYTTTPITTVAGIAVAVASRIRRGVSRRAAPVRARLPEAQGRCRPRVALRAP